MFPLKLLYYFDHCMIHININKNDIGNIGRCSLQFRTEPFWKQPDMNSDCSVNVDYNWRPGVLFPLLEISSQKDVRST